MHNKIKQLKTIIKSLEQKYNLLMIDYIDAFEKYTTSNNCIHDLREEIVNNKRNLFELMSAPTEYVMEKHTVIQNYIKSLFVSLHNEIENNEELKLQVDSLDLRCISVKTESKGYEILVDRYKDEISEVLKNLHNKEMDEMWLLKRNRV